VDYDEPWNDETDEETFRPWTGELPADPSEGMLLVRATLTLHDGTTFKGFRHAYLGGRSRPAATPHVRRRATLRVLGRQVRSARGDCQRFYAALGRSADAVFPVAFSVDPGLATGVTSGIVEGFRKNDERLTVER